ncbi:MAG TPA: RDD family protein, partial [Candidatus Tumulicola sp.]
MDRNVDVRTPESVELTYHLAGLGSRFLAVAVDQAIQIAILVAILAALALIGSHAPPPPRHEAMSEKLLNAIATAIVVFVVFAIFFGYFIAFEAFWNGQTPGKKLLGIRVVRDGGFPIDLGASVVRNLVRVGEFALGYYAIAAASTILSSENKRLGDIAAGTLVVRDQRIALPAERAAASEPVYGATRYLSGEERALIARFLERRDALSWERRKALAAQIAERVRERLPAEMQAYDDEGLLE